MSRLAELKVISYCPTRYPPGSGDKAVDRRTKKLQGEYAEKARKADRQFVGTEEGSVGPVENKLLQYGDLQGLVVGAFGEGSEDLHSLVQVIAESRVASLGLARGREGTEIELGIVMGQARRMLSTTCVRAQAQCLLARMSQVGEGVAQAAKRRRWVAAEEERMRKERMAQWIGRVRGRNIVRRGQFLLN